MTRAEIKAAQMSLASYYSGSASASVLRSVADGNCRTICNGREVETSQDVRDAARSAADAYCRGEV